MSVKNYAFVNRRCPVCHGDGGHPSVSREVCPTCHGTGYIGSLEETPEIRFIHPTPFSELLRCMRIRKNLTVRELSLRFGMSPSRLSELENGLGTPTSEEEKTIREWMEVKNEPYN